MSRPAEMDRQSELIQAGVDGELTPDEVRELEALLESSGEARDLDARLRQLDRALADLPGAEPPPGLHQDLMAAAGRATRRRQASPRPGWRGVFVTLRYVGAFAAGLLLTAVLYEMGTPPGDTGDLTGLAGSMIQGEALTASEPLDGFTLDSDVIRGEVDLRAGDSVLVLQFRLESTAPVQVVVDYGDPGLGFGGFAQTENELSEVEVTGGRLRLVSEGRHRFAVFLRDDQAAGARVGLKFMAAGEVLHEQALVATR